MYGRLQHSRQVSESGKLLVDLSAKAKGIYIVVMKENGKPVKTIKLVKQ